MSEGLPDRYVVSALSFSGSNTLFVQEGEPGTPVLDVSQPRSAAFQVVRGFLSARMIFTGVA